MAKIYNTQERAAVMTMRDDLCSIQAIALRPCGSASTIGREITEGRFWTCRASISALRPLRTASSPSKGRASDQGRRQAFVGGYAGRAHPGFVALGKMDNPTIKTVVASITVVLNVEPMTMRKTMTCDQGREILGRKILTERTGLQIDFADPHGPWQRGNESANGLLRQYISKDTDLSICSQEELNAIALSLNTRQRTKIGFESTLLVYT